MPQPVANIYDGRTFIPLETLARWMSLATPKKMQAFREELYAANVPMFKISNSWQVDHDAFYRFIELRKKIAKQELEAEANAKRGNK